MTVDSGARLIHPIKDGSADRPLVLILPGLSGNLNQWDLVKPQLESMDADLAYGSPILPHPALHGRPTVTRLVDGMSAELAAAGRTNVILIAHSVGAFTALGLAHKAPAIVKSVMLVNGGLATVARFLDRPFPEFRARPRMCLKALKLFVLVGAPAPLFIRRLIARAQWSCHLMLGDLVSKAGLVTREQRDAVMQEAGKPQAWWALWANRHHWPEFASYAAEIMAPVQFLVGGADPIGGQVEAEDMATLLPNASITVLPRVGHAAPLEAAQQVADAIKAVLPGQLSESR